MKIRSNERSSASAHRRKRAFSMLEVVLASAIFFMVAFSVLGLVASSLASARRLQQRTPDAGLVAATLVSRNDLEEGSESGDFEELHPGLYPGYRWSAETLETGSNGLWTVNITVYHTSPRGPSETSMQILYFCPDCPPGSASTTF